MRKFILFTKAERREPLLTPWQEFGLIAKRPTNEIAAYMTRWLNEREINYVVEIIYRDRAEFANRQMDYVVWFPRDEDAVLFFMNFADLDYETWL